jgi:phosphoglycolate phosphatase
MNTLPVLLWDIDGSILSGTKVEKDFGLVPKALQVVANLPETIGARVVVHGSTDRLLLQQYLEEVYPGRILTKVEMSRALLELDRLTVLHANALFAGRGLLPGVKRLIALAAQHGVVQGLLTGNTRFRAHYKVGHYGLGNSFLASVSAFGDEAANRISLFQLAKDRCLSYAADQGCRPQILVIGDTPSDIVSAAAVELPILGVATGAYTRTELIASGAKAVTDTLVGAGLQILEFFRT